MVRRVVTGVRDGKHIIVSDEEREERKLTSVPGMSFAELWTADATPPHPAPIDHVPSSGHLPAPGTSQFEILTLPPDAVFTSPHFDPGAAAAEQRELMPGVAALHDPDHPGMHATPTLDYAIVLDGAIVLEVGDGSTTTLGRGDVVIQCGTRHAWHNPHDVPATLAVVLIGDATASTPS